MQVVPYDFLQRYWRSVDVRKALRDQAPFKITFGVVFLLATVADFQDY